MMVTPNVRLTRPLNEGGMGAVWVADHLALRTQVVVKFMTGELAKNADALARFEREAAAASQVKSPHVVQTFDHGFTSDGIPYIVMELLEGQDLGDHLDKVGRLEPNEVVSVVSQLGRALDKAHAKGIVHRDIKPNNIFLTEGEGGEFFVKLLDFGIAKGVDMPRIDSATRTGAVMGSPFYMSPEQIVGAREIGPRSDLWAVGVVAFEALTGVRPFDGETMGALAIQIHGGPIPLPSSRLASLPEAVDRWFEKACCRDPEGRFTSARALADALGQALAVTSTLPPTSSTGPRTAPPLSNNEMFAKTTEATAPSFAPAEVEATALGMASSTSVIPAKPRAAYVLGGLVALVVAGIAVFALGRAGSTSTGTSAPTNVPLQPSSVPTSPVKSVESTSPTLVPLPSAAPSGTVSAGSSGHIPKVGPGPKPHPPATGSSPTGPHPVASSNDPLF